MIDLESSLKAPGSVDTREPWRVPAVCLLLAAITFAVFGQTLHHGFINYDDSVYVYENAVVAKGLTWNGVLWAFTYGEIGHWHPLTWLTHMADCQIYGLNPKGHHLTNVLLHTATVILLFLALREMTSALWRSAFVAAIFAIHPLRVESVAWIAERKDVLSGMFFMLTLWAYARYARQPSHRRCAAVAVLYGLGLLCKNTLVTLPFVLLLLDWWPLQRVKLVGAEGGKGRVAPYWDLVKEKIPLFLLSVGSCVATFLASEKMKDSVRLPFLERIGNAVVSYGIYLRQMFYPAGLAIPYLNPPNGPPFWEIGLAFAVLAAISISVLACWKGRSYLLVGWLWYLGMLVPAIGIVQISYYAHADRYTYLPGIGLILAGTWAVGDWSAGRKYRRVLLGGLTTAVIAALMVCACKQTMYWKSSETLWTHTLACTPGNVVAHNDLGNAFAQEGRLNEALSQYQAALQIQPDYAEAHNNLGNDLLQKGREDEAIAHFQKALQIKPDFADALNNLGLALLEKGRMDEAIVQYQKAVQLKPDDAEVRYNLGVALLRKGGVNEAVAQYQKALEINPDFPKAHVSLGLLLLQSGSLDEAITHFQKALQIQPDNAEAHGNIGTALFKKGEMDEAITHFQIALKLQPGNEEAQFNLGNALSQMGKVDEAIPYLQTALQIKPDFTLAHLCLGGVFFKKEKMDEAITQYKEALQSDPSSPAIQNTLAWLLATCPETSLRNGEKAVELARQANDLTSGGSLSVLHTLAAAYAEAGQFPEAVDTALRALHLAEAQSKTNLARAFQAEIKLYQAGKPFHNPAPAN